MIDVEKLRNKWRVIDEDTRRAMKTGEEFYRWTVTPDMPSDVFELLAEIERLNGVIKQLTETTESFLEDKYFYMEELRKADAEIERLRDGIIDAIFDLEWGCYTDVIYDLKKVIRYDEA
jgi:hypothetical protein